MGAGSVQYEKFCTEKGVSIKSNWPTMLPSYERAKMLKQNYAYILAIKKNEFPVISARLVDSPPSNIKCKVSNVKYNVACESYLDLSISYQYYQWSIVWTQRAQFG